MGTNILMNTNVDGCRPYSLPFVYSYSFVYWYFIRIVAIIIFLWQYAFWAQLFFGR